jgi:hypothetical protein
MNRHLNIRQQRFAEFVVSGMSATQAYLRAGYKVSEKVAGNSGSRMMENDGVKAFIAKLRAPDTAKAVLTKDEKREILAELIRKKKLTPSDIVRCMAEDSKLAGHYEAERIEVETGPITLDTIKEIASRVRGQSPLLLSKIQQAGKPNRSRHATPQDIETVAASRFRPLSLKPRPAL